MRTHPLITPLLTVNAANVFATTLIFVFVLTGLTARARTQDPCSLMGDWSVEFPNANMSISVNGNSLQGALTYEKGRRTLRGDHSGDRWTGEWTEEGKGGQQADGTFEFVPLGKANELNLIFYNPNKVIVDSWRLTCPSSPEQTGQGGAPQPRAGQTLQSQGLSQVNAQTPTWQMPQQGSIPIGIPGLGGSKQQESHDTDNFRKFDALPRTQQLKLLTKNGPRLPQRYEANDLSFRALVKGGWPISIDYGLEPNTFAELTISVPNAKPLFITIEYTRSRDNLSIRIPTEFGQKPQVAKLRIVALTKEKKPAYFHLYGLAMGEKGVLALRKVNAFYSDMQLAMNIVAPVTDEPLRLFRPNALQDLTSVRIGFSQPTEIRPKQKPPLAFKAKFQSTFSDGRWELWHVDGFSWNEVWQKKTGSIKTNQTKSGTWDGISTAKKISLGQHAVQLTVWHGRESDRDWVVARGDSLLTVKK